MKRFLHVVLSESRLNVWKHWRRLNIGHEREQYYTAADCKCHKNGGDAAMSSDEIRLFELRHKVFLNSDVVKSEEEKSQKQKMKKKHIADRAYNTGHAWYKKGNFKMAMSEDHTTCWVHKDLTASKGKKQALVTAAWASGGKDECHRQV
jgi:long-subunit acyl-CoA synthetase (AMP-forming)